MSDNKIIEVKTFDVTPYNCPKTREVSKDSVRINTTIRKKDLVPRETKICGFKCCTFCCNCIFNFIGA